ncbi:hypothetical protein JVU11DRAFT_2858 [Chiua virens]|nr:hypothetical protein JVU11DRAFT_2858 [Chiua virens]
MGCVQSTGIDSEAKARNDEIENQLKKDRMLAKNEIKMLLLGAGESGKVRLHTCSHRPWLISSDSPQC